jgi:glycerol-3-phosphate responsive antiterminator
MNNLEIEQIPSVFESNNAELRFVSKDFINGLKITHNNIDYIVGNLALNEGVSPHRNINSAPDELDYNLLLKAGLLIGSQKLGNPITVTTGFPFSTYQLYKNDAKSNIAKEHMIEFDSSTFSNGSKRKTMVEVDIANVMPEVVGCALALRKQNMESGNFFMVSLGYGTFEAIVSTADGGLVQRSAISTYGLRYAINLMQVELSKNYYLDLKNEHQLDTAFRNSFIFLNRKRVDLKELKKLVLKQYYDDIVSPALRKAFDDSDFSKASKMFLAGGGAFYEDLVEYFKLEFDGIVDVVVPENAAYLAAIGYCYNSLASNGGDESRAVGIDIGNATTVIASFSKDIKI